MQTQGVNFVDTDRRKRSMGSMPSASLDLMTDYRNIRDARIEEAELLCNAEREIIALHEGLLVSLVDELRVEAFQERISCALLGVGKYLVAETENKIVGHASLRPMDLRQISHVFRLDMCVHQQHWRQGHGRALLEALIDWAIKHPSAHKIELLVRSSNIPAIALYRSLGFTEEGRHVDRVKLVSGRFIDDIAMSLLLP
jgi:L-phenylalanine/L-methionine N-acetyltransferase